METKEKIKKVITVSILNILLPTIDIFSDLIFIISLLNLNTSESYSDGKKVQYAIPLLFFFLLNYSMSFFAWFRFEKEKLKTIIFPLLVFYPQFCKYPDF